MIDKSVEMTMAAKTGFPVGNPHVKMPSTFHPGSGGFFSPQNINSSGLNSPMVM